MLYEMAINLPGLAPHIIENITKMSINEHGQRRVSRSMWEKETV